MPTRRTVARTRAGERMGAFAHLPASAPKSVRLLARVDASSREASTLPRSWPTSGPCNTLKTALLPIRIHPSTDPFKSLPTHPRAFLTQVTAHSHISYVPPSPRTLSARSARDERERVGKSAGKRLMLVRVIARLHVRLRYVRIHHFDTDYFEAHKKKIEEAYSQG